MIGAPQSLVSVDSFTVHRITVDVQASAEAFRARYEAVVPPFPRDKVAEMVERRASWDEMIAFMGSEARFGFFIYGKMEVDPVMQLAGDRGSCVAYLMGNHTIAERMFRFEPLAMLHAPLRTAIWAYPDGQARFSLVRPSDLFASFGDEKVAAVGRELDHKVVTLLDHLGVAVPNALGAHEA